MRGSSQSRVTGTGQAVTLRRLARPDLNRYAYLLEGLTLRRVAWVTGICAFAAQGTAG